MVVSVGAIAQQERSISELSAAIGEWLDSLDTDEPGNGDEAMAAVVAAIREDQAEAIDAIVDLTTAIDADIAAAEAKLAVWTEFYRRRIASLKGQKGAIETQWLRLVATGVLPESLPGRLSKVVVSESTAVVVEDFDSLPEKFLRVREPEADKAKIGKAIKAGEVVRGATMATRRSVKFKPLSQRDRAGRSV